VLRTQVCEVGRGLCKFPIRLCEIGLERGGDIQDVRQRSLGAVGQSVSHLLRIFGQQLRNGGILGGNGTGHKRECGMGSCQEGMWKA